MFAVSAEFYVECQMIKAIEAKKPELAEKFKSELIAIRAKYKALFQETYELENKLMAQIVELGIDGFEVYTPDSE